MPTPPDVLIVEDSPTTGPIVQSTLGKAGISCTCVNSVKAAMDAVDAAAPRIVITDVRFPEQSGFTLCKHLRNHHKGVAIIVISGYDDLTEERDYFEGAHDVFLPKPFKLAELIERVRALLQPRRR